MKHYPIGTSALQIPIFAFEWGINSNPGVLIIGGVHGDEVEGVALARSLVQSVSQDFNEPLNLIIIPEMNPDGVLLKTRGNGHGIDLNRNLPTKDWVGEFTNPRYNPGPAAASEPENRVLMKFIEDKKPKLIISLHSWHPVLNVNGDILPEAEKIAEFTNYKIDSDIGYPTPGCLGTYTGLERGIGTLTYEIERGLSLDRVIKEHTLPIREALKVSAARLKKG